MDRYPKCSSSAPTSPSAGMEEALIHSPVQFESPLLKKNEKKALSLANVSKNKKIIKKQRSDSNSSTGTTGSGSSSTTCPSSMNSSMTEIGSPGSCNNDEDVNCTVFGVEEWGSKRWIRLEVIEPVTITAKNFLHLSTSFTTYLIRVETNHYAFSLPVSEVRRRYSEFRWLRTRLAHHHPNKVIPPLPPKHFFSITNFNEKIINERRYGLGKFLQRVCRSSVLLSDSALHMFLQTNLTTKEMNQRCSEEYHPSPFQGTTEELKGVFPMTSTPLNIVRDRDASRRMGGGGSFFFRSVSVSSSLSASPRGTTGSGYPQVESDDSDSNSKGRDSDNEDEDYCDISSSEEFDIDVEN